MTIVNKSETYFLNNFNVYFRFKEYTCRIVTWVYCMMKSKVFDFRFLEKEDCLRAVHGAALDQASSLQNSCLLKIL